jgi:hypothetical protein
MVALNIAEALAGALPCAIGNHSLIKKGVIPILMSAPNPIKRRGIALCKDVNVNVVNPDNEKAYRTPAMRNIVLNSLKTINVKAAGESRLLIAMIKYDGMDITSHPTMNST